MESIAAKAVKVAELNCRTEVNLVDMLHTLAQVGVGKKDVSAYLRSSKFKQKFSKNGV